MILPSAQRCDGGGAGSDASGPPRSSNSRLDPFRPPQETPLNDKHAPREKAAMPSTVNMKVNGKPASGAVEPRTLLVQFLRETLGLTGTHVGCDTSQCGACVVHVNGESIKSCTLL